MISTVVALGNPGKDYAKTRHNFGWLVAETLASRYSVIWTNKWQSRVGAVTVAGRTIQLLLPEIFMNRSGEAVRSALTFYKQEPSSLLVLHDDLETPFGSIRARLGGGAGGHNGLRSLDQNLGSQQYYRLKLGIGRPVHGSVSDFVLGRFTPDEQITLPLVLELAMQAIEDLIRSADLAKTLGTWQNRALP